MLGEAGVQGAGRDAGRAAVRDRRRLGRRPAGAGGARARDAGRGARRGARRRQPGGRHRAPCGAASTRRATRSRRPRCSTAARPRSPRGRTSARSSSCSRCRTTRRCALYTDSVLGPIESGEGEYGGELLRSLEAFVEHNGQWERAARELFCHRHTLRYRIRRVEQLTGPRPLERARPDRVLARAEGAGAGDMSRRSDARTHRRRARRRRHDRAGRDQGPGRVGRGGRAAAAGHRRESERRPPPASTAGAVRRRERPTPAPGWKASSSGCDVLVNCASYRVNLEAMQACLAAGCHYIDLGGLYWLTGRQLELHRGVRASGTARAARHGLEPGQDERDGRRRGPPASGPGRATRRDGRRARPRPPRRAPPIRTRCRRWSTS